MIVSMLANLATWIIHVISTLGYPGILLTMAIESCMVPLPSEIIMPFSGYLVAQGQFSFPLVVFFGALGNTLGSLAAYYLGFWGHERVVRRLVRKYGQYILFTEEELNTTEGWMHKYKVGAVFLARVIPGVRTFISVVAGIVKLPVYQFVTLTFLGSLVWSSLLAYIGFYLGKNWESIGGIFHKFDAAIVALLVFGAAYYIYHKLHGKRK